MKEGDRYGRLVVREVLASGDAGATRRGTMCRVRCDCGVRKTVPARYVKAGTIRSCGKGHCRGTMQPAHCRRCGRPCAKAVLVRHERKCGRRERLIGWLAQIPGVAA